MLFLLGLLIYGLVVGGLSKLIHPGPHPIGLLTTVVVGIVGSYVGGFVLFLLGRAPLGSASGLVMGIVGGVISLAVWRWWNLQNSPSGPRACWTGQAKQ